MAVAAGVPLNEHVARELRAELARQRISGRQLARRLNVNPMWVSVRTRGAVPISLSELELIIKELDIPLSRLLPRLDSNQEPAGYGTVVPLRPRLALAHAA